MKATSASDSGTIAIVRFIPERYTTSGGQYLQGQVGSRRSKRQTSASSETSPPLGLEAPPKSTSNSRIPTIAHSGEHSP